MTRLGDLCEFRYGKSLPAQNRREGSVPVYGSNGVVGCHDEAITNGKTIVIGRKGSVGQINLSAKSCWPIDTTYYVDSDSTDVDINWLSGALSSLRLSELNKAAAVPGLNRSDAYEKKLFVPRIDEQRRISAILDKAEALRQKRKHAIALLDSLTQSIFLEMFGDPAVNDRGFPLMTVGSVSERFSDGPFGSNLKSSHYVDAGIRVVRLQNIGVGEFIDDDAAYVSEDHFRTLSKHECLPGDVLIGTLGDPNLRACVQPKSLPKALNKADCVQMRPNRDMVLPHYITALLNLPSVMTLASGLVLGQTRGRISMGRLRELKLPIAPMPLQERFETILGKFSGTRRDMLHDALRIDALFASLQHRAFSGQL